MDRRRRRTLAREVASTLVFLFVTLILMFLVLQDTNLTDTHEARVIWLVIGLALLVPALACWLYCQVSDREDHAAPERRHRRRA
ncbi:MAG: hypothetical protein Kow00120_13300 [Anaerolineae bacterium]